MLGARLTVQSLGYVIATFDADSAISILNQRGLSGNAYHYSAPLRMYNACTYMYTYMYMLKVVSSTAIYDKIYHLPFQPTSADASSNPGNKFIG